MACFIAPLAEAIAVTAIRKSGLKAGNAPFLRRLPDLEKMLWGGTLMLIVDHIINGELTWAFPFFTALTQTDGAAVMWKEVLTVCPWPWCSRPPGLYGWLCGREKPGQAGLDVMRSTKRVGLFFAPR